MGLLMANTVISPNMNLPVPVVGQDLGPQYATDINNCMALIDQHDHSSGEGVQITPAGLNINAALALNTNALLSALYTAYTPQASPIPAVSPAVGALYVAGVDLYYNDINGEQIQITSGGHVNAGAGSITGLPSGTAGVTYSSVAETYIFTSSTLTPANLDAGSVILRNLTMGSNGITLQAPNSLGSDYSITLPPLPSSTMALTITSSGIMGEANFSGAQLTAGTVTQAAAAIKTTGTTATAGNVAISSSSGSFSTSSNVPVNVTNLSVTITSLGNPIEVWLQPDGANTATLATIPITTGAAGTMLLSISESLTSTEVVFQLGMIGALGEFPMGTNSAPSCIRFLSIVGAGTRTYNVAVEASAHTTAFVSNCVLVAREIP